MRLSASTAFGMPLIFAGSSSGPMMTKSLYMTRRRFSILPSSTYFRSSEGAWTSATSASPRAASASACPVPTEIVLTVSPVFFSNIGHQHVEEPGVLGARGRRQDHRAGLRLGRRRPPPRPHPPRTKALISVVSASPPARAPHAFFSAFPGGPARARARGGLGAGGDARGGPRPSRLPRPHQTRFPTAELYTPPKPAGSAGPCPRPSPPRCHGGRPALAWAWLVGGVVGVSSGAPKGNPPEGPPKKAAGERVSQPFPFPPPHPIGKRGPPGPGPPFCLAEGRGGEGAPPRDPPRGAGAPPERGARCWGGGGNGFRGSGSPWPRTGGRLPFCV